MRKKLIPFIIALTGCLCLAFGFSACANDADGMHKHTLVYVEATAATCTEAGNTAYYNCPKCGKSFLDEGAETEISISDTVIAALGHDYADAVTAEATCTEEGVLTHTCTRCGGSYTEAIPATGHTAGEAVMENEVETTCTENGSYDSVIYCTACNEELSRDTITISATGHNYKITGLTATCTEEGVLTYTCTRCGDTYTETVAPLGHNYIGSITKPTCTKEGYSIYTCTRCGDSYTEITLAMGHVSDKAVTENNVAATCTEDGSCDVVVYCADCGEELSRETLTIPAVGHSYQGVVTEPTCTEPGYTTYTCTVCGNSYVGDNTEAAGHNYVSAVLREATCTAAGVRIYACQRCGDSYTETIAPLGHDYVNGICTRCGAGNSAENQESSDTQGWTFKVSYTLFHLTPAKELSFRTIFYCHSERFFTVIPNDFLLSFRTNVRNLPLCVILSGAER